MTDQHTPARCTDCRWEHVADSNAPETNFMGVRLCPKHAATDDLLAALLTVRDQYGFDNLGPGCKIAVEDAIDKAKGKA